MTPLDTPGAGPEPVSRAEREAFQRLVSASLPAVQTSVQTWRNGLAGLIGLVATGIVTGGRQLVNPLATPWRWTITAVIGIGMFAALFGLWRALTAEAGTQARLLSLEQVHSQYLSVEAYQVGVAITQSRRLRLARWTGAASLILILVGVMLTWLAPPAPRTPPAYLKVTTDNGSSCGRLTSADGAEVHLAVPGASQPAVVRFADITNLTVVDQC